MLAARGFTAPTSPTGTDFPDRDGGRRLLGKGIGLPRLELVWADGAYTGGFRE